MRLGIMGSVDAATPGGPCERRKRGTRRIKIIKILKILMFVSAAMLATQFVLNKLLLANIPKTATAWGKFI